MSSDASSVAKSQSFIDDHKLSISLSDVGVFTVPADLHKTVVLDDEAIGITEQQHNRLLRKEGELFSAMTLLGAQQAVPFFKDHPDHREVALSYPIGKTGTASVIYSRGEDNKVTILGEINTRFETAEFNRVVKHADTLFSEINS